MGPDPVLVAELADLGHCAVRGARQSQRLGGSTGPLEPDEVMPEGHRKTAVAPARARATDVGFDHEDVQRRLDALDLQCGPQPREPAPDDADVSTERAAQLGRRKHRPRLLQPPADHLPHGGASGQDSETITCLISV